MKIMNNKKYKLSEHFNAYEFRCRCGKSHFITIDEELVDLLEKLRTRLKASSCTIYSGYRCPEHDKRVGGSGGGPHTQGKAVDCYFVRSGKRVSSQEVALTLEDMGHKYGIGYRCGGGSSASGQTHIDTKHRFWYGDESKSMGQIGIKSYYTYLNIKKKETKYNLTRTLKVGSKGDDVKQLQKALKVSVDGVFGAKTKEAVKSYQKKNKLTADGIVGKSTAHKLGWNYKGN